jgi:hypothetical protein
MLRFRLKCAIMAVPYANRLQGEGIIVPAGSEVLCIDPIEPQAGFQRSRRIAVEWEGKIVRLFLVDLLERSDLV